MGQSQSSRRRNRRNAASSAAREVFDVPAHSSTLSSPRIEEVREDEGVEMQSRFVSSNDDHQTSLLEPEILPSLQEEVEMGAEMENGENFAENSEEISEEREMDSEDLGLPPLFDQEVTSSSEPEETPQSSEPQQTFRLSIIYFVPYRRRNHTGGLLTSSNPFSSSNSTESSNGDENAEESEEFSSAFPLLNEQLFRILFAMIPMGASSGFQQGDFHHGSFEDLLDQLMRQHQPQGPPPTSKSVLNRLPVVPVDEEMTCETCLVCQENFQMEESALKMPCKHLFHKDCVTTWLEQHCTCPTCRYELPVDDKDYESERKKRMAGRNIDEEFEEEEKESEKEESEEETMDMDIDSRELFNDSLAEPQTSNNPLHSSTSSHHSFQHKFSPANQQEATEPSLPLSSQ